MKKSRPAILALIALSVTVTIPVLAQTAPPTSAPASAKNIGPAPANSKQHQVLDSALSDSTRKKLQEAMDKMSAPVPASK